MQVIGAVTDREFSTPAGVISTMLQCWLAFHPLVGIGELRMIGEPRGGKQDILGLGLGIHAGFVFCQHTIHIDPLFQII
jgi:hypothetical protein